MARHFADSDLRLTREDAREFLSELQRVCQRELAEVGRFKLTGIGTLVVRERKSRMARHPVTGKPVLRPGHRVVNDAPRQDAPRRRGTPALITRAQSADSREATESHSLRPPQAHRTLRPQTGDSSPKRRQPRSDRIPLSPPSRRRTDPCPRTGNSSPNRREPRSDRIPLSPPSPRRTDLCPRTGIRARSGDSRGATESHSLRLTPATPATVAAHPRGFEPEAARAAKRPNPTLSVITSPWGELWRREWDSNPR